MLWSLAVLTLLDKLCAFSNCCCIYKLHWCARAQALYLIRILFIAKVYYHCWKHYLWKGGEWIPVHCRHSNVGTISANMLMWLLQCSGNKFLFNAQEAAVILFLAGGLVLTAWKHNASPSLQRSHMRRCLTLTFNLTRFGLKLISVGLTTWATCRCS